MAIQRVLCLVCSVIRKAKVGFADRRRSYTKMTFIQCGLHYQAGRCLGNCFGGVAGQKNYRIELRVAKMLF
jgi:hypothetical protein